MAPQPEETTLAQVKQLLDHFSASRAGRPREEVQAEYGELLLYLILLAGKSGVDLVAGANVELERMARDVPRPVDRRL